MRTVKNLCDRGSSAGIPKWEPKFRIHDAGADLDMSMHVDSGVEAKSDRYLRTENWVSSVHFGSDRFQAIDFISVVQCNKANTLLKGKFQLIGGFVVAVKYDRGWVDSGFQGTPEFSAGDHIKPYA